MPAAYAGIARVLEPGGHFLVNCWVPLATHEVEATVIAALAERFPDDPPTFLARVPHGYHDEARVAADVQLAGFRDVRIETVTLDCRAGAADLARGYCRGTPLRAEIEARGDLEATARAVATTLAERFGSGPVVGRMAALVVTASRPSGRPCGRAPAVGSGGDGRGSAQPVARGPGHRRARRPAGIVRRADRPAEPPA